MFVNHSYRIGSLKGRVRLLSFSKLVDSVCGLNVTHQIFCYVGVVADRLHTHERFREQAGVSRYHDAQAVVGPDKGPLTSRLPD